MSEQTLDFIDKKDSILKLVVQGCPQKGDFDNHSCPLRNVRKLIPKNLIHYLNGLSEYQIDNILAYHNDCVNKNASFLSQYKSQTAPAFNISKPV